MKKIKYSYLLLTGILIFALFISGCSSKQAGSDSDSTEDSFTSGEMLPPVADREDSKEPSPLEPEKVITTVSLNFETTGFDDTIKKLSEIIDKHKAYIENSNVSYNQYYGNKSYKQATYTVRVPKNEVTSFKNDMAGIGNMTSENTNKEDVSKYYTDTESRLKVVTTKEARLLSLMEKATKIEDIIALENQLSDTIYEKEQLKGTLQNIDDKVAFSTINLNIQEVERLSNVETPETSFWQRVSFAVKDSFYSFRVSIEGLIINLIYLIPFLLLLGIVGYPLYLLAKKIKPFKIKKTKNVNKNKTDQ